MGRGFDWEQRYSEVARLFGDTPSELLLAEQQRFQPGQTALAAGDGEGRNGVWLAEQGLQVLAIDISATALQRSRMLAEQRGVRIETLCTDLLNWSWPATRFDVITSIFIHLPDSLRRQLHQSMWQALKPGGLLLIEGFHVDQAGLNSGGPSDPTLMLSETILEQEFPEAEILRLEHFTTRVETAGVCQGDGAAIHFVARKPA